MTSSYGNVKQLLAAAAINDAAGQAALDRLYRHYDPLIRAALPKGLPPEDAEDLAMDTWADIVAELRRGHRLRAHADVVALIAAHMRAADVPVSSTRRRSGVWVALKRFIRLLLPGQPD